MLAHGDMHPNAVFPLDTAEMLFEASELRDVQNERAAVQQELRELRGEALVVTAELAALRAERARLAAEKLALEEELLASGGVSAAATEAMLGALDGEQQAVKAQLLMVGRRLGVRETAAEKALRDDKVYAWETRHIFGPPMARELHIPGARGAQDSSTPEPSAPDFHATELPPVYP
jgi:hypothetical protein